MVDCVALIVAAGRGSRAGPGAPKQYRTVGRETVIRRSLMPFLRHPDVNCVRVVIHPDDRKVYAAATAELPLLAPVIGGPTRQASVHLGLESLAPLTPKIVLIHDAARPFVTAAVISRVLEALAANPCIKGAVAALPLVDTLKRATSADSQPWPVIVETVDRRQLWRAQTPQGFDFSAILHAHRSFADDGEATDDAVLLERAGERVILVPGEESNIKLTSEEDLKRAAAREGGAYEFRTGTGFDVHRFSDGDHVMLCGIAVPHTRGLAGHSDADVALHALTDALLGAIAAGDIGQHFPPWDARWRGISSDSFLADAAARIARAGGCIINVDVTIICERPRIGPHREVMAARIASILGIDRERASVKATTTERLGFTGRGEGIAAQAVASVRLPVAAE